MPPVVLIPWWGTGWVS